MKTRSPRWLSMVRWVLFAYPPGWRHRYGNELLDVVTSDAAEWRTVWDVLCGSAPAWGDAMGMRTMVRGALAISVAGAGLVLISKPGSCFCAVSAASGARRARPASR